MNKSPQDFGIPILTEVIDPPPRLARTDDIPAVAATAIDEDIARPSRHIDGWIGEEWTQLEQKVSERVLTQILDRVDKVLEQRIRDNLADVLQVAVEKLSNEIREGLQQTLEGIINDAVAQEIEQLKFTEK